MTPPGLFMLSPGVGDSMPRPIVEEENRDRLADFVDRKADVPADILTFDQQLAYLLDQADGRDRGGGGGVNETTSGSAGRFR